ncbi:MAG: histidine kinase [Eubacteriales bacterium]|nr:histidine kinase [Eubacteriales bacterium]
MKRNKRFFLSRIQRKIFGCYFLMMGILTFIIIMLFLFLVKNETKNLENSRSAMAERISSQLDMSLSNMDMISFQVIGENDILKAFEAINEHDEKNHFEYHVTEKINIQNILLNINGPRLTVGRISLFNQYGDYVSYGKYYESGNKTRPSQVSRKYTEVMDEMKLKDAKKEFVVHKDTWNGGEEEILSLYRPLKNSVTGKISGIAEIQTYLEEVFDFADFESSDIYHITIFNEKYGYVYSNDKSRNKDRSVFEKGFEELKNSKERVFLSDNTAMCRTEDYAWYVVLEQNSPDLVFGLSRFLAIVLGMIIIVVFGTVLLIFIISKKLTAPLVELTHSLKNVRMSNLSVVLEEEEELDVIKELNQAFSVMFLQLNQAIENETKINLRILQSQMDPHFLYNILSVIKAAVYDDKSCQIPMLCDRISHMLRYSSSYQDRNVPLAQEIEYAQNYCELMKARYEDMLEVTFDISADIHYVQVPKLIIQPLIENCFKHGFADKEGVWNVSVKVVSRDGRWEVRVKDNGTGFTEAQKEEIQEMAELWERNPKNIEKVTGIGLRNTIMRLYLYYKEDFSYEIQNNENHGAEVMISGPIERI